MKATDQNWKLLDESRIHIGHLDGNGMSAVCCTAVVS